MTFPSPRFARAYTPIRCCLVAALALLAATTTWAIDYQSHKDFLVGPEDILAEELWLQAETLKVEGVVQDDLFALTQSAWLSGTFRNDVWILGEEIELRGDVWEHARLLAGKTAHIEGSIGASLTALGSTVRVTKEAVIERDAVLVGEDIISEGHVKGRIILAGRSATLGGHVGGSARVIAEDIVVLPGAEIDGDLVYTSSKELFLDDSVKIGGELVRKQMQDVAAAEPRRGITRAIMFQVFFYLGALLTGTVWIGLFPKTSGRAVRAIRQSGWRSALTGFISFGLIPMLSVFLLFTVVGIPLSVVIFVLYLVLLYLAKMVVAVTLGAIILHKRGPQPFGQAFSALALGLLVIYALAAVPAIGFGVSFFVTILGLGGLVLGIVTTETRRSADPNIPGASITPPHFPTSDTGNDNRQNKEGM